MNIHHFILFCFSSAALFDGNSVLVHAQLTLYTKMEGQDFRQPFDFQVPAGSRKYLCRNKSRKEDVLIETHGNRAQSGRYGIRYDRNDGKVYAVITKLTQSDAGWYKVGVSTSSSLGSYMEFELKVRDLCDGGIVFGETRVYSTTAGGNVTLRCSLSLHPKNRKFLCRDKCNKFLFDTNDAAATSDKYKIEYRSSTLFDVTITGLTESDSGQYRCGVGRNSSKNTCQEFEITVTRGKALPLVVGVTVLAVLLAAVVLLSCLCVCKWKTSNVDYVNTTVNGRHIEFPTSDNSTAVSRHGSLCEALDPYSREQNLYTSLHD